MQFAGAATRGAARAVPRLLLRDPLGGGDDSVGHRRYQGASADADGRRGNRRDHLCHVRRVVVEAAHDDRNPRIRLPDVQLADMGRSGLARAERPGLTAVR